LAVVNALGYGAFDERVLINTTAEGGVGAADSASVIYSTSARTSVAFRVVGYVTSTQATAGAYATAPSNVNGVGGTKVPQDLVSATAVATTSGTSVDFTGIPSWVKRITVMFNGVNTNGSANVRVRIGPSGGVETSGYLGASLIALATSVNTQAFTDGFDLYDQGSLAAVRHGALVLSLQDPATNTWAASGNFSQSNSAYAITIAGIKPLAGALSIVRVTTANGTDTFDAGSVNILYE
jgi:hypothetical protein